MWVKTAQFGFMFFDVFYENNVVLYLNWSIVWFVAINLKRIRECLQASLQSQA